MAKKKPAGKKADDGETAEKGAATKKKAAGKKKAASKKAPPEPRGLAAPETRADAPAHVAQLCADIEADGGAALAPYRDPLGGHWLVLATLPIEQLGPTPYQRGLSDAHAKKLGEAIERTDRYLDPVIAFRTGEKSYQTPNGHHRASAMKNLGARAITALVVTEPEVARMILALNVEKAHNLKEKCEEVIKLARELVSLGEFQESDLTLEFEEPTFLTLGLCYEERPRFAGSAYSSIIKRADSFREEPLAETLELRGGWAATLLALDERVAEIVKALKEQGLDSPYLKNFVVARINPFRSVKRGETIPMEEALQKATAAAAAFETDKVDAGAVAKSGGYGGE